MAAVGRVAVKTRWLALLIVFQIAGSAAFAETIHDARLWMNVTGQGRMAHESHWRWYFDVQNRDRNSARDIDQFVVRPGVGYVLTDRFSLWAGYAYTANFTAAGKVYENRTWEQMTWSPAASSPWTLRTRVEQRFFQGSDRTGWRGRQQVRFAHAIKSRPSLSAIGWDEVFFHLNTTSRSQPGLDQNRAFGGIGIKLNSKVRLDVGYLNQFVHSEPANRMNHVLSGVLNLSF